MRIFFAHSSNGSFVMRDLRILREQHQVSAHYIKHYNPFRWLADLPSLLGSRVVFFWFAGLHNLPYLLAAVFFGKKVVTVVGGYEAANRPDLGYGQARGGWRRHLTKLLLKTSDVVLAVSKFSRAEICENLGLESDRVKLLYHGFEDLAADLKIEKEQLVVNVGRLNQASWKVKGIADFVAVAARLPDVKFRHIGVRSANTKKLKELQPGNIPPNLELIGAVPFEHLAEYLSPAQVYLQLSDRESFGCSVAEAMLLQAVPVVARAGALPEVVGECGYLVAHGDINGAVAAVETALKSSAAAGEEARQRILREFSYEKRRDALLKLVEKFERRAPA
jgi:glycosyltransferase involved in cell wall biosynthesis